MTSEDIQKLKKTFGIPTDPWKKAFEDYNKQTTERPLSMNCRSCWFKVLKYHEKNDNY